MPINIGLALSNLDFNKNNIILVDGLSIDKLKIRYNWIFNAIIENAILGENEYGLVWYGGTWLDGEWYDGTWYSGVFKQGVWKNGNFYSYKLNKYDIVNGVFNIVDSNNSYSIINNIEWLDGNFYGGTFGTVNDIFWNNYNNQYDPTNPNGTNDITSNIMNTCIWRNGNFNNGVFFNSIWYNGNWYNGTFENSYWINGKFYNGIFNGYIWWDGIFLGGDFTKGIWKNGTFTMFDSTKKSRFGVSLNQDITITEHQLSGETNNNNPYPTLVYKTIDTDTSKKNWVESESIIKQKMQNPLTSDSVTQTEKQYTVTESVLTKTLTFKGFNIDIPSNSVITGIVVDLSLYNEGAVSTGDYVRVSNIGLSDSDSIFGYTNKADDVDLPSMVDFSSGSGVVGGVFTSNTMVDGSIVLGGNFTSYNGSSINSSRLLKLDPNGSKDENFNIGTGFNLTVECIAFQTDKKILVGGSFTNFNGESQMRLIRLNYNGSKDNTFNIGTGFNNYVSDIKVQPDGKILVSGNFTTYNGLFNAYIIRLNSDGSKDTTFNNSNALNNFCEVMEIQSDGKILVGGNFTQCKGVPHNRIARLNSDGSRDSSFVNGTGFNGVVKTIKTQPDGKILIGGIFTNYSGNNYNRIIRLNSDGSIDNTFNIGTGFNNVVYTIELQTDGKVLVGGLFTSYNGSPSNYIVRLNSDGSIDNTFNIGTGFSNTVYKINVDIFGHIVCSGIFLTYKNIENRRIIKLNTDGSVLTGTYTWNKTYGASNDTWNNSWLIENINNPEKFALNLQLKLYKNSINTNYVRGLLAGVKIKIYYNYYKYNYDYTTCIWESGTFNNGEFHSGLVTDSYGNIIESKNHNISIWNGGIWNNGRWFGGKFKNGIWNNGDFYNGFFGDLSLKPPIWNNGIFHNGFWINGYFNDGDFKGGMAKDITFKKGTIGK